MRKGFAIHHNGPPAECVGEPHSRCLKFWAAVRNYHKAPPPHGRGWSDIAYSFGICPHGERLEGRGWSKLQWANGSDQVGTNNGPDSQWFSVLVFVGGDDSTRDTEDPTAEMKLATKALIHEGRSRGRCGLQVKPHSDWKRKPCPGDVFRALARAWDGRPFTPDNIVPQEESEMLIVDSQGKPALILGVGGVKRISSVQRDALREIGVDAKQVDNATSDALFSLAD